MCESLVVYVQCMVCIYICTPVCMVCNSCIHVKPTLFSNQIMLRCTAVFETWDDEFEKFANQLREMSKKKREESIKFTWKANTAHRKLQDRTTRMKE